MARSGEEARTALLDVEERLIALQRVETAPLLGLRRTYVKMALCICAWGHFAYETDHHFVGL